MCQDEGGTHGTNLITRSFCKNLVYEKQTHRQVLRKRQEKTTGSIFTFIKKHSFISHMLKSADTISNS